MSVFEEYGYGSVAKSRDLLQRLPREVREIGEEVLHAISCGKKLMGWNDRLQLTIDGRAIPNTNITDLIQYILYPEPEDDDTTEPPHGFDTFVEGLKSIGLESQWVRNEYVIEQLDDNENEWDTTDSEASESDDDDDVEMDGNVDEDSKNNSSSGSEH